MHNKSSSFNIIVPHDSIILIFQCIFIFSLLLGCSPEQKKQPYSVKINSFQISEDELNRQLKFESEVDSNFHVSESSKNEFIQRLIESQVLLQEAKRLKLDEQERFRQTIERYWQSTLIRDLLNKKGDDLRKTTVVSVEEVKEYFEKNKDLLPDIPFEKQSDSIRKMLENEKVREEMQRWIESLRKAATIEIRDSAKDTHMPRKQEK